MTTRRFTMEDQSENTSSSSSASTEDSHVGSRHLVNHAHPHSVYNVTSLSVSSSSGRHRTPSDVGSVSSDTPSLDSFSKLDLNSSFSSSNTGAHTPAHTPAQKAVLKYAHMSNEYVRLGEVLSLMSGEDLKEILLRKLWKKDPKTIVALGVLLPRKVYPALQNVHCARCHKIFNPKENSNCILRHPTGRVVKTGQDTAGADFRCSACNKDFRLLQMYFYDENVNSYYSGFCYHGKHTSNPGNVEYGGAAKTCQDIGCVEFYV